MMTTSRMSYDELDIQPSSSHDILSDMEVLVSELENNRKLTNAGDNASCVSDLAEDVSTLGSHATWGDYGVPRRRHRTNKTQSSSLRSKLDSLEHAVAELRGHNKQQQQQQPQQPQASPLWESGSNDETLGNRHLSMATPTMARVSLPQNSIFRTNQTSDKEDQMTILNVVASHSQTEYTALAPYTEASTYMASSSTTPLLLRQETSNSTEVNTAPSQLPSLTGIHGCDSHDSLSEGVSNELYSQQNDVKATYHFKFANDTTVEQSANHPGEAKCLVESEHTSQSLVTSFEKVSASAPSQQTSTQDGSDSLATENQPDVDSTDDESGCFFENLAKSTPKTLLEPKSVDVLKISNEIPLTDAQESHEADSTDDDSECFLENLASSTSTTPQAGLSKQSANPKPSPSLDPPGEHYNDCNNEKGESPRHATKPQPDEFESPYEAESQASRLIRKSRFFVHSLSTEDFRRLSFGAPLSPLASIENTGGQALPSDEDNSVGGEPTTGATTNNRSEPLYGRKIEPNDSDDSQYKNLAKIDISPPVSQPSSLPQAVLASEDELVE